MKKMFQDYKTGFGSGAECRQLNKNETMYHLYKNIRSMANGEGDGQ